MRLSVLLILLIVTPPVAAQDAPASRARTPEWRWAVNTAAGWKSPNRYLPAYPDHRHGVVGLRASKRVVAFDWFWLAYSPTLYPAVLISAPDLTTPYHGYPAPGGSLSFYPERFTYGAGLAPLAAEFGYDLDHRVGVYGTAAVGGVWFAKDFPTPDEGRLAGLTELGAGVRIRIGGDSWIATGYKHHRQSSWGDAAYGPKVVGRLLFLDVEWRSR